MKRVVWKPVEPYNELCIKVDEERYTLGVDGDNNMFVREQPSDNILASVPQTKWRLCQVTELDEPPNDELLEAIKLAYCKHHMGDDSIGWDELSNKLADALSNAMGAKEFADWQEQQGERA